MIKAAGLLGGNVGIAALAVSGGCLIALGAVTVGVNAKQLMELSKDMNKPINTMTQKKSLAIWSTHLRDQGRPIFSKKETALLAASFGQELKKSGVLDQNGQINKKELLASKKTPAEIQDTVKAKIEKAVSNVLNQLQTESGEPISQDSPAVKAMIDNITTQTLQEFGWPEVHLELKTESTGKSIIRDLLSESNMLTDDMGRFKESPVKTAETKLQSTMSKWVNEAQQGSQEASDKLAMAGLNAEATASEIKTVVTTIMHAIGMHDPDKLSEAATLFPKAGESIDKGTERLHQQLKSHGMLDQNGMVKSTGSPEDMASIFAKMSTSNPEEKATIIKDILSETSQSMATFNTFKETLSDAMGNGSTLGVKKDRYTTDNMFAMGKAVSGMVAGGGFMSGGAAALVPLCSAAAGLAGPISLIIAASAGCVLATMGAVQDFSQMQALQAQQEVVTIALDVVKEKLDGINTTIDGLEVQKKSLESKLSELENPANTPRADEKSEIETQLKDIQTKLTETKEAALPTQINTTKLTLKQKLLEIKSEIKKLSAIKQVLFAVGAALALACCAIAIAGTFGAAAIPLAIIGGVAGASILSGVGVQLAQNKLGNPEKAEEGKQAALADLAQLKKDFDTISKQVAEGSLSGTDLNQALHVIADDLRESGRAISDILKTGDTDPGFKAIFETIKETLNTFSTQNGLDMQLGDIVLP